MARKLPSRIKFYRSPPHTGKLLAKVSSRKTRSVRRGDNAFGSNRNLGHILIAMAEDPYHLRGIAFGKPNRFKDM